MNAVEHSERDDGSREFFRQAAEFPYNLQVKNLRLRIKSPAADYTTIPNEKTASRFRERDFDSIGFVRPIQRVFVDST